MRSIQFLVIAIAFGAMTPIRSVAQDRCDFSEFPGVVWWGTETEMSMNDLASYMAPILWFSPDEPSLLRKEYDQIRTPEPFPGTPVPDRPVLYYQLDQILARPHAAGPAFTRDTEDIGNSMISMVNTAVLRLNFLAYFEHEQGLGAHPHDIEPAEFRATILPHTWEGFEGWIPGGPQCDEPTYVIAVTRTSGKAHGLVWYWNVLETDEYTSFPMHLLVEEGKHALATDKNGDGVFTHGYDVSVRINDAWGVRDIIRTGRLVSGSFQSWMAKVRRPEHRVFPPLPADSPLQSAMQRRIDGMKHSVYELRPFPGPEVARGDEALQHLVENQHVDNWPTEGSVNDISDWANSLVEGAVIKSLSIAALFTGDRAGKLDVGLSFVFPAFVARHLEEPLTGGYIVQRIYLKDTGLRDFGWQLMFTPSASRWIDTYLAAGAEHDERDPPAAGIKPPSNWDFVLETGFKFRINVTKSPLKFLPFTDFWGIRFGVKNVGFPDISRLTYVIEFGAGSF